MLVLSVKLAVYIYSGLNATLFFCIDVRPAINKRLPTRLLDNTEQMGTYMDMRWCFNTVILWITFLMVGCTSTEVLDEYERLYDDAIVSCEKMHPSGVGPHAASWIDPEYDVDPQPKMKCETYYRP